MTSTGAHWTAATLLLILIKALSCLSLTCSSDEYEIRNTCCTLCAPGSRLQTDCTGSGITSCLPCSDGTFMDKANSHKACLSCTKCAAGSGLKVKSPCSNISDTVCEPMEGFYCMDPIKATGSGCAAAHTHTNCTAGQYLQENGTAYRDTVCSDCSNGTFSDGTLTSCQPHRQCEAEKLQLIKAGTPSEDAQCGEPTPANIPVTVGAVVGAVLLLLIFLLVGVIIFYKKHPRYFPAVFVTVQSRAKEEVGNEVVIADEQIPSENPAE